jgi:hypothetical protein
VVVVVLRGIKCEDTFLIFQKIKIKLGKMVENDANKPHQALSVVLDVLENATSNKKFQRFILEHGENVAFLMSRVALLQPSTCPLAKRALELVRSADLLNEAEPGILSALHELEAKKDVPAAQVSGYPTEFPRDVLSASFDIATNVFVAQALAIWTSTNKTTSKLATIVDVALARLWDGEFKETTVLHIHTKSGTLTPKSETWLYFVTHIVLVATMWGEVIEPVGGSESQWETVYFLLFKALKLLGPFALANSEIYMETLFCLHLLSRSNKAQTKELYVLSFAESVYGNDLKRLHNASGAAKMTQFEKYHTFILHAFYFALKNHTRQAERDDDSDATQPWEHPSDEEQEEGDESEHDCSNM